jgi:protocatechuate 3,4-dioxygenase alpha subunit
MNEPTGPTPSQTVGPFLAIVLPWEDGPDLAAPGTPGLITVTGTLTDGAAEPVPDGLIEVWQADPDGRFDNADDPRGAAQYPGFRGFGRCPTDATGSYAFRTLKPGALPAGAGGIEAPHLDVSVFARGLLNRLVTRIYFPDEPEANSADPVLAELPPDDRRLLTAVAESDDMFRFDIRIQGEHETPFFVV